MTIYNYDDSNEQLLYAHIQDCIESESPSELLDRFRRLFIEAVGYPDPKVWQAISSLVASKFADREFPYILNRSCHIPINRWLSQPQQRVAIPELVGLFETAPTMAVRSRTTQRLRQMVQDFTQSEQYRVLRYQAQVIGQKSEACRHSDAKLRTLIRRYPYLYEHCLLTPDTLYEEQQQVRLIREQQQRQFERDLSKYITYQRLQQHRRKMGKEVQPIPNPTLLGDPQLNFALQHFSGKVDGFHTYRDLARQFRAHSSQIRSFRAFKDELYEYLATSIEGSNPKYAKKFNPQLYRHLQNTLPQNDRQKLNEDLMRKTCRKVLDFLVVESVQHPNHYIFGNLTDNLGPTPAIGLLLKLVLFCRQVKSYLEQRFAILFNHYEATAKNTVGWLVESLENLNVAFSLHFGQMNLSVV